MIRALAALAVLLPAIALAQPISPPPNYACGSSITACGVVAPRTNVLTYVPGLYSDTANTTDFRNNASGHMGWMGIEAPDDVVGVALILGNGVTAPWTLSEAIVAPSAQWGGGTYPGTNPINNLGGNDYTAFMPVTWANNGQASMPYPGSTQGYGLLNTYGGTQVLTLNTSAATAAGSSALTFSSTFTSVVTDNIQIQQGMFVFDGLGCIPPGTTVAAPPTGTGITLSNNVVAGSGGSGCGSGQWIAFSYAPPGPLSIQVPGTTVPYNAGVPNLVVSDWAPLASLPRLDNPSIGQAITDPAGAIQPNTTITSVSRNGVGISLPTTAAVTNEKLTSTFTLTTVADSPPGTSILAVPSTAGLSAGMLVVDGGVTMNVLGIQDSTHVLLYQTMTADTPPGTALTFQNVFFSQSGTVAAGASFIPSSAPLDNKPIILIRYFTGSQSVWAHIYPFNNTPFVEAYDYNLPGVATFSGGNNGAAVDGLNFPATSFVGNGSGAAASPIFGVMFLTKHNGIQCLVGGDSHMEGTQTASGWANASRRACYDAATPAIPTSVANLAHFGYTEQQYLPIAMDGLQLTRPGIFFIGAGTGNSSNEREMAVGTVAMRQYANSIGTKTVTEIDYPAASMTPLSVRLAQPVSGLSGVMNTIVPAGFAVTNVAVTCTGCTAGLTASTTANSNVITFSAAQALPAQTPIAFNVMTGTTTAASTAVTLATPAPFTGTMKVAGPNLAVGGSITMAGNSTSATLSNNATATGAGSITLSNFFIAAQVQARFNAQSVGLKGAQSTALVTDPNPYVTDFSVSPMGFLPGYSWDGIHGHDGFVSLYEQNIMLPLVTQMRGN